MATASMVAWDYDNDEWVLVSVNEDGEIEVVTS